MSRKNALPLWQSSSITATNLSSSFLLLLATSTLFFLAILLIDPTNSLLVLARPSSSLNSHRNREITVEEQQQLVELTEESGSSEAADGIRYGLTEETTNEEGRKATSERTLSRDTFFSLDPEPNNNNDDQTRQRTSQNSRALRGQRKRHRNRNRGAQQRQEGVDEQIGADGNKKEEEDDRLGLVDGQSLLSLTSVDIVNTTLQANTCRGDLFKHKVRVAGCRPKTITNRFCHGSCSSFYIPRLRSKKLKATFQSCAACVPSETDLVQVRLDCPNREEGHIYRTIVRVKKCACRNIVLEGEENDEDEPSTASVATITDDDGMNGGGEDSGNDGPSFASED